MSVIIVISILILILATAWSLAIAFRSGKRRILFLTGMLAVIIARQVLMLAANWASDSPLAFDSTVALNVLPDLTVSLMAFLLVLNLEGLFSADSRPAKNVQPQSELPILPTFAIGLASILGIVIVSLFAYRDSRDAIRETVAERNLMLGRTVCGFALGGSEQFDRRLALDRLSESWAQTDSPFDSSYLCVIGPSGTLDLHTKEPAMIGTDVSEVVASNKPPKSVMTLLRNGESWSGQNVNFRGISQLVGYHYEPTIDSLVAVHVPARNVDAAFHDAAAPWIGGMILIGGFLLPFSLGLLFRSSLRGRARAQQGFLALSDSEDRYRRLVKTSPFCIHEIELDGRISSMNPAGLAMMGIEEESEVCGVAYLSFVKDRDRERIAELLERACFGRTAHFEFHSTSDRIFDSNFLPLLDSDGQVQRIMGISHDITDKKCAEALILSENAILESIAKGRPQQETLQDLIAFIESQSPELIASILVLDDDKVHLRHGASTGLPDAYVDAIDGIAIGPSVGSCGTAAYRGEQVFVDDVTTDSRWENYRELAAQHELAACWSAPIKDAEGKVLGTLAIYRGRPGPCTAQDRRLIDISTHLASVIIGRDQAETALRQSEARFRTIFEQAAVGVAVLNSVTGSIMQANRRYCEIVHMPMDDLIGKTWMELTHPDDLQDDSERMAQLCDGKISEFSIEKRLRRSDDHFVWINLTVSGLWKPHEAPSTHIAIVEDITARKQAEEDIRQHRDMLAHVTRLSTMGELMAGIAHEVKQPLYAISNFATAATVALRSIDPTKPCEENCLADLREWNQGVRDSSQRASEIIQRLRDFVRKDEAWRESLNINQVVRDSVELVAFEGRDCEAQVELFLDQSLPNLVVDRIQCEQILVNLLHNSFEALAGIDHPRRVKISTHRRADCVEIVVHDNGPGIGTEVHGKLFDAFYTTKTNGMGMGLAISRTIVEDHGGRLWASSSDCGASFHVTLPLATTHQPGDMRQGESLERIDSV